MPHGQPDYGAQAPLANIYSISDLGELAARLNSLVTYDRQGNIWDMEDFGSGISQWAVTQNGGSGAVAQSNTRFLYGGVSAQYTVGMGAGAWTNIRRNYSLPLSPKLGVEITFAAGERISDVQIQIQIWLPGHTHNCRAWLITATGQLQVETSTGWVTVGTISYNTTDDTQFHRMKMTLDYNTRDWLRFLFDSHSYSLAGHIIPDTGVGVIEGARIHVMAFNNGADDYFWLDQIILTQNEP